jgi:hypothetical protein
MINPPRDSLSTSRTVSCNCRLRQTKLFTRLLNASAVGFAPSHDLASVRSLGPPQALFPRMARRLQCDPSRCRSPSQADSCMVTAVSARTPVHRATNSLAVTGSCLDVRKANVVRAHVEASQARLAIPHRTGAWPVPQYRHEDMI